MSANAEDTGAHAAGDDGDLVLAVQRGDVDAFAQLYRRHYPAVRRACERRLSNAHEADEVSQAAFVRALERIGQCAGERRFGPWIHVIARSLCMDAFRAHARVEPRETPLVGRHDHRPNEPEESLLSSERAAQVQEALATLPDRQRRAVIARDWEGLRPGEIADRLGLSVGAVDSLLLRARRRLALSYRRLAGEGGGGAGTVPIRPAAAGVGVAVALGSQTFLAAAAAAAQAVQDTAGRAAGGVASVVVSVALSLSGGPAAPSGPRPAPPAAARTVVDVPTAPVPPPGPAAASAVVPATVPPAEPPLASAAPPGEPTAATASDQTTPEPAAEAPAPRSSPDPSSAPSPPRPSVTAAPPDVHIGLPLRGAPKLIETPAPTSVEDTPRSTPPEPPPAPPSRSVPPAPPAPAVPDVALPISLE